MITVYCCLLLSQVVHELVVFLRFQEGRQPALGVELALPRLGGRVLAFLRTSLHLQFVHFVTFVFGTTRMLLRPL